jgi:enoyl-[acyl-carrier protein] reductase I
MTEQKLLMAGKRGLIMGVANDRSIAWGITKALSDAGAELAFTYQGDALGKRVMPLAESVGSDIVLSCDVTDQSSVEAVFATLKEKWGGLDFLVHATTRDNFLRTLEISCFSFTSIARHAAELMGENGSMLTLTYYGAEKVVPHYNVMGVAKAALEASVRYMATDLGKHNIRVNALSAGPVKTLAASGIGDFRYILKWNECNAPLKRNVSIDEIGQTALYLLSDMSSAVTGEVHHVDCGYHTVGMKSADAPDISVASDNAA